MTKKNFRVRSILGALLFALAVFVCAEVAFADGGRLRFREPAGPFIVTLFTTPDPLTTGHADFSVAVERAGVPGLVPDAHVDFILTSAASQDRQLVLHASHAAATSKWLQATNFSLPAPGLWRVTVVVRRGQEVGQCSSEVRVRAAGERNVTWDILPVPLVALLLLLHENRKRKYDQARRSHRPSIAFHICS